MSSSVWAPARAFTVAVCVLVMALTIYVGLHIALATDSEPFLWTGNPRGQLCEWLSWIVIGGLLSWVRDMARLSTKPQVSDGVPRQVHLQQWSGTLLVLGTGMVIWALGPAVESFYGPWLKAFVLRKALVQDPGVWFISGALPMAFSLGLFKRVGLEWAQELLCMSLEMSALPRGWTYRTVSHVMSDWLRAPKGQLSRVARGIWMKGENDG